MNGQTDFTVKAEPEDFKNTLFLAMELSRATWLVATFAPRLGDKISVHAIPGGDTKRLLELIGRLQAKLRGKGVSRVRTVCCYEAGYDGFWLHRVLVNHGVENHVLDAASLRSIVAPSISRQTISTPASTQGDCRLRARRSAKLPGGSRANARGGGCASPPSRAAATGA